MGGCDLEERQGVGDDVDIESLDQLPMSDAVAQDVESEAKGL